MILIKSNIKELSVTLNKLPSKIKKGYFSSIQQTTKLGEGIAKSLAPIKRGVLREGIYSRIFKDRAELRSGVSGFPYNFWVNQTSPFEVLHFRRRNPFFKVPQDVVYGQSAVSPSGRNIVWTGMPAYMDVTAQIMDKNLIESINNTISKALKSK